jgi:hypothetical protein
MGWNSARSVSAARAQCRRTRAGPPARPRCAGHAPAWPPRHRHRPTPRPPGRRELQPHGQADRRDVVVEAFGDLVDPQELGARRGVAHRQRHLDPGQHLVGGHDVLPVAGVERLQRHVAVAAPAHQHDVAPSAISSGMESPIGEPLATLPPSVPALRTGRPANRLAKSCSAGRAAPAPQRRLPAGRPRRWRCGAGSARCAAARPPGSRRAPVQTAGAAWSPTGRRRCSRPPAGPAGGGRAGAAVRAGCGAPGRCIRLDRRRAGRQRRSCLQQRGFVEGRAGQFTHRAAPHPGSAGSRCSGTGCPTGLRAPARG